jgi:hypothetical protein
MQTLLSAFSVVSIMVLLAVIANICFMVKTIYHLKG